MEPICPETPEPTPSIGVADPPPLSRGKGVGGIFNIKDDVPINTYWMDYANDKKF